MIGLLIKIPFHAQIRRALPELSAALESAASEVQSLYGARRIPSDESFFLVFDEDRGCSRLRAVEAARILLERLNRFAPRLHGYSLIMSASGQGRGDAEELERILKAAWYLIEDDGFYLEKSASALFSDYLESESEGQIRRVKGFLYAGHALPDGYQPPSIDETSLGRFTDELGAECSAPADGGILVAVGPGTVPARMIDAALKELYKDRSADFPRFYAAVGEPSPYGPFLAAFSKTADPKDLSLLSADEAEKLAELSPIADFLRSSPYRRDYSGTITAKLFLYASARLRLYARQCRAKGLPAVLVFEGLDRYPKASLELTARLLSEGLGQEGVVALGSAAEPPGGLERLKIRTLAAPPPSPAAIAAAAKGGAEAAGKPALAPLLASSAEGDPFRLGLVLRLALCGRLGSAHLDTGALAAAALSTFPPEFAELVYALSLAEEVLDDQRLMDFLDSAGFAAGIRPMLFNELIELGYLSPGPRPRLLRAESLLSGSDAVKDQGRTVRAAFIAKLLALQKKHSIQPSTELYESIEPLALNENEKGLFYLDCIAADELYGSGKTEGSSAKTAGARNAGGRKRGEGQKAPAPLAELSPFFRAYAVADAEGAAVALDRLRAETESADADPLAVAMTALCSASDQYARGEIQSAAACTRPALIALHGLGARRAEARSHRLLGLLSLAQSQVQEGADYLENAYEIAGEVPDPFECFGAAYSEAAALLVLGDLRRAESRGKSASEWAAKAFRSDWDAACSFLGGRIDFEFGRYELAAERFRRVKAMALFYSLDEAAARAEIWAGRALAYAGKGAEARVLLSVHADDAEARWFSAELSNFEGDNATAAKQAADALSLIRKPAYLPADCISWNSGFESLESRALGFGQKRSYLEDQIGAFADYSAALCGGGDAALADLEARTREERLAAMHPQVHLYHFYCYKALEVTGSTLLDQPTILSKSFKALQMRIARMDEAAFKDEYLEHNRWNKAVCDEARKYKFI